MIDELLPDEVVTVETREELLETELFPEELPSVARAVEKRRREFVTGRACARRALERLGFGPSAVPAGERGEPRWPGGVVGSITHCRGYRACAATTAAGIASLGIDAEPHEPLPDGILETVASARERARLAAPQVDARMDRVLFSAKEAVYKAWFPLARRWLGFEDVDMSLDASGAFRAALLVDGPRVGGAPLTEFAGRWVARDGLVLTAVVVPR